MSEKKAKFTSTEMMPFSTCNHCEQNYVVIWVHEVTEEGSYDPSEWGEYQTRFYQDAPYCPYCGERLEGR